MPKQIPEGQGYVTGFHLIPARNNIVIVYLTHNTYGKCLSVNPLSITLDGRSFKNIGELCTFITSVQCRSCIGTPYALNEATSLNNVQECERIELETQSD